MTGSKYTILFYAILLALVSCDRKHGDEGQVSVDTIDLTESANIDRKINLSEIASNIEYIKLETNSESIIRKIDKIILTKNFIIINDQTLKKVFLFDLKGNFKRLIGREGKGPGEYLIVSNLSFDHSNQILYLYDGSNNKILLYDLQGNYLRDINLNFWGYGSHFISGNYSALYIPPAYYNYEKSLTNNYSISVIDGKGQTHSQLIKHKDYADINPRLPIIPCQFYNYFDTLSFKEPLNDTIYRIDKTGKKARARFYLKIGKDQASKDLFISNLEKFDKSAMDHINIGRILETENFFFITYRFYDYQKKAFYSKNSKENYNVVFNYDMFDNGFHNDIDGGMPFWPMEVTNDGRLIGYFYAYKFNQIFEHDYYKSLIFRDSALHREYVDMIEKSSIEDNPIVQITTLK